MLGLSSSATVISKENCVSSNSCAAPFFSDLPIALCKGEKVGFKNLVAVQD